VLSEAARPPSRPGVGDLADKLAFDGLSEEVEVPDREHEAPRPPVTTGRLKLVIRPVLNGSVPTAKTVGVVVVAALAAIAVRLPPVATSTLTCR
jgi:hypothetical protein